MTISLQSVSMDQFLKVCLPILIGLSLRYSVGLHSHSGQNQPPMFGDFEAQRHWMEITLNLPVQKWYSNSSDNDLEYWGLDYPPLTAYHSWLVGIWSNQINASWTELHSSRGLEDPDHKLFMRQIVVLSDLICFLPVIIIFFYLSLPRLVSNFQITPFYSACLVLTYPGLILIDHGHFQFNCISLGLFLMAVIFYIHDFILLGSVWFCLALCYKQMELYHSLPIFFYCLGQCLFSGSRSVRTGLLLLIKLGLVVSLSFCLIFVPFRNCLGQVIHRLFPIYRGLFEDKVANFWCVTTPLIKWRSLFDRTQLVWLCTSVVITLILPACLSLLFKPSKSKLLIALPLVSMTFYLFSFQVHEKSILLVAIPALCLFPVHPLSTFWFAICSTLSMWSLYKKDHLQLSSICTLIIFFCFVYFMLLRKLMDRSLKNSKVEHCSLWILRLITFTLIGYGILIFMDLLVRPPSKYPDLFALLLAAFSFVHFIGFLIFWNVTIFIKSSF